MHIAVTVDPYIAVPPKLYGGIERVVNFVVDGLIERGHLVTLFAHPDSETQAELIAYGMPPHFGPRRRLTELGQLGSKLWRGRDDFDVVLSWGRLASLLPILPLRRLPKLQRYCRNSVPWTSVKRAVRLAGDSICFIGASTSVYGDMPSRLGKDAGEWRTIFDGVELEKYDFVPFVPSDAPLVFLGRIEPIKGTHHAIAIAKAAKRKLVIAGNQVTTGPDGKYFDKEVAPHIDDDQIKYIGPVDDAQKNRLLGSAAALLMPIDWQEAFGIVMAESMACGTPVIAFPRGSIPEIVRDGSNGFVRSTVDEAAQAVNLLTSINRSAVRSDCETRFSANVIVDNYERLCREMVNR